MASLHEIDVDSEYTQTDQKEQFEAVNKQLGIKEVGSQVKVPLSGVWVYISITYIFLLKSYIPNLSMLLCTR